MADISIKPVGDRFTRVYEFKGGHRLRAGLELDELLKEIGEFSRNRDNVLIIDPKDFEGRGDMLDKIKKSARNIAIIEEASKE